MNATKPARHDDNTPRMTARAFGTWLRRRGTPHARVLVVRANNAVLAVRDAVVQGLLLSGHDVVDRGCAPTSALATPGAAVRVGEDGSVALSWHGAPLPADARSEITRMMTEFDVVTGEGSLVVERA